MVTLEEELEKNFKLRLTDLETLKEWYTKQFHLPTISDEFLALFLHSCNYCLEFTKTTLDNYFTVRTHNPQIFRNRDPFTVDIKHGKRTTNYVMLPKLTPSGHSVLIFHFTEDAASSFVLLESLRAYTMTTDLYLHQQGSSRGWLIVIDLSQVTLALLPKVNLSYLQTILFYVQEAQPAKIVGLHFINVMSVINAVVALLKPFVKKEFMDTFHFHSDGFESLYEFVPKDILPKEYGGDAESLTKFDDRELNQLKNNKEFILKQDQFIADESKRPAKTKTKEDVFGVDGSFRKIDID